VPDRFTQSNRRFEGAMHSVYHPPCRIEAATRVGHPLELDWKGWASPHIGWFRQRIEEFVHPSAFEPLLVASPLAYLPGRSGAFEAHYSVGPMTFGLRALLTPLAGVGIACRQEIYAFDAFVRSFEF
jgi:hypothetical protein